MLKKIVRRQAGSQWEHSGSTVLARVFANRGVSDPRQIDYSLSALHAPDSLAGLNDSLELLYQALLQQKKICIVGDFDADGATSTALGIRALRSMGFHHLDYVVPNRFEYGYGLTPEIVLLANENRPDIILTVDNGISSIEGVKAAKVLGITVLVTDHHLPGRTLPDADAIVNPNQGGCAFPSKNLAGVGVIFYLLSALRKFLRTKNWFVENQLSEPNMADFLDLVALGTVADVVPLDHNNRILVEQGLRRIRAGKCCAGITALAYVANKNRHNLVASDMGFAIGPRLNAAGRLEDMSLGIQCLLSDSQYEAENIARDLDDLNKSRRDIESHMQREALALLAALNEGDSLESKFGICVFQENWHEGVIGILASRIKEKFYRPTIVFALTQEGELKGSGRSIEGVHLRDVLDEVATANPGLLEKFGGHAMAAGLSLERSRLNEFMQAFDHCVAHHLDQQQPRAEILSDGELDAQELNLETAFALRNGGPWGQTFSEPLFDGEFQVIQQRLLKEKHLKLLLAPGEYSGKTVDAIAFNVDLNIWPDENIQKARVVYRLDINEYRGNTSEQLIVEQIEPLQGT